MCSLPGHKVKPVIQRRLDSLKAFRFRRYVLSELVWWASCEAYRVWAALFCL